MTRDQQVVKAMLEVSRAIGPLGEEDRKRVLDAIRCAVDAAKGGPLEIDLPTRNSDEYKP
jgi:hypothetical protein